jgi:hypothetical protein
VFGDATPETIRAFSIDRAASPRACAGPTIADATCAARDYLGWLENQLADGRKFFAGEAPSIADFLGRAQPLVHPPRARSREHPRPHGKLDAWYARMQAFGHGQHERLASPDAIAIAANTRERAPVEFDESQGFVRDEPVNVSATDYGADPVAGLLAGLSREEVVVRRNDERAGRRARAFPAHRVSDQETEDIMKRRAFVLPASRGWYCPSPRSRSRRYSRRTPRCRWAYARRRSAAPLRDGLRELGYVEGKNVAYETRFAESRPERLPAFAEELVRLKVDAIVAQGWMAQSAAKQATSVIPIVTAPAAGDLVGTGMITSLARPGGNLTGLSDDSVPLSAKRMELLKEAVPKAALMAVLWNADDRGMTLRSQEIEKAARILKVDVKTIGVRRSEDLAAAYSEISRIRPTRCSSLPMR